MFSYVDPTEIESLWKSSFHKLIKECRVNSKVPERLVELIKHNLFAKYVSYDAAKDLIEIGVNESLRPATTYPNITVYTFPLDEVAQRLQISCRSRREDIEFYAKIFTGKNLDERLVVL